MHKKIWAVIWLSLGIIYPLSLMSAIPNTENGLDWEFEYDEVGRIIRLVDPGGKETRLSYEFDQNHPDRIRRLLKEITDELPVTYEFDEFGRRVKMSDEAGTVRYEYDDFSRLKAVSRNKTAAISYTYDTLERLSSIRLADEFSIHYAYDFLGRLSKMQTPVGDFVYEYNHAEGKRIRKLPNGVFTVWEYLVNGDLESIAHVGANNNVIAKFTYHYRPDGLIRQINEWAPSGERSLTYEYDAVQRLVAYSSSRGEKISYTYDQFGNRTGIDVGNGSAITSTYDWGSRLLTHHAEGCRHDASGNLTAYAGENGSHRFEYNGANLLKRVDDGKVIYEYDGDGYLIARTSDGVRTAFFPDPNSDIWHPLIAIDANGDKTFYIWEGNIPLAAIGKDEAHFFLHDHLGSVRLVLNKNDDEKIFRQDFSPFGMMHNPAKKNELQPAFSGLYCDAAVGIYITRARGYDPQLGRFLQREPVNDLISPYFYELSSYSYCCSNPINYVDKNGFYWDPPPYMPYNHFDLNRMIDPFWKFPDERTRDELFRTQTFAERILGPFLNWVGKGSYWIGPNRSGGEFSQELDQLGRLPLGNSRIAGVNAFDEIARWHDIQDYVNWHYNKDTEVEIAGPHGIEYYTSRGRESQLHNWEAAGQVIIYSLPVWNTMPFRPYIGGRRKPQTTNRINSKIDPDKINNEQNRQFFLPPPPPGSGGVSALSPSNVGGIYLRGASQALAHLGTLNGIALDENHGRLILLSEAKGELNLPPLRLDDLVTVFRCVYDCCQTPYVSIDPDPADPEGPVMLIRHGPGTDSTYVGWILFEADRVMKAYSLGYDNITRQPVTSQIAGFPNLFELGFSNFSGSQPEEIWERFWIVPAEVIRRQSGNGQLTLFDVPLKVKTQRMILKDGKLVPAPDDKPSKPAQVFSAWFTENYDAIAQEVLSRPPQESGIDTLVSFYAELRRVALMTAIAEALRDQAVPMPTWMRDYEVEPCLLASTTPAMVLEASKTETTRVVQGNAIKWIESRQKQRIYGGVTLSADEENIHTIVKAPAADDLISKLMGAVDTAKVISHTSLENDGEQYQTCALPGDNARDVSACQLQEVDLVVPVQRGKTISLSRKFNSFFEPSDIFGKNWSLDLPYLKQILVPAKHRGDGAYQMTLQVMTPLNTFRDDFLDIYRAKDERIGYETQMLVFPNRQSWHFDNAGNLVAVDDNPLMTIYRRGKAGEIHRIEGWYGSYLRADIQLKYNEQNRIELAIGSNQDSVKYRYHADGLLADVERSEGNLTYQYHDGLVGDILRNGELARHFDYNEQGQLLREIQGDGTEVVYRVNYEPAGIKISALKNERAAETIQYDPDFRPVQHSYEDGTQINWTYFDDSVKTEFELPSGEKYSVNQSADGRHQTLKLPPGGSYQAEYDEAGRLLSLKQNQHQIFQQNWRAAGKLESIFYETFARYSKYREDGVLSGMFITPPEKCEEYKYWMDIDYDELGQITKIADYTGSKIHIGYSQSGEINIISSTRGGFQIKRNSQGKIDTIRTSWGLLQNNSYDTNNQLTRITLHQGRCQSEIEFERELVKRIRQFDGGEVKIAYHDEGRHKDLIKEICTPGNVLTYEYGNDNRISSVNCDDTFRFEYIWDDQGRLVKMRQVPINF
ncbi:hypothetical protein JXJ21_21040 [candidate division KSB1 bacterium]|nr:hypothetical protein [candidate division KSB1 bacterium]